MFPWWISWQLRWWASTVCSLTILLSFQQSFVPTVLLLTAQEIQDNMEGGDVQMFVEGEDRVYKWDPTFSKGFELQFDKDSPFPTSYYNPVEERRKSVYSNNNPSASEESLYKKNRISNKYQEVRSSFYIEQSRKNSHLPDRNFLSDDASSYHYGETVPYPVGNYPSQNIIFPFKSPRDITSLEVPSRNNYNNIADPYNNIADPYITSSYLNNVTPLAEKRFKGQVFNSRRPPPQVVSQVSEPTEKAKGGRSKGMGGSAMVDLHGRSKQEFATEPAPQTAVVGSTAVLPCRVMGKVGHLQWTKDGFGMGTDRDLYGFSRYAMIGDDDEGDYSLRIQPVLLEDDALFQCQVSAIDGFAGIRSRPVRLTVYVPPDPPIVRPKVLETTAGTQSVLECESIGGRPPPEIQWVDDSRRESIQMGSTVTSNLMPDNKRSIVKSRLTFTSHRYHNNKTLTCLTSNQALSSPLTSSILLHVMFSPQVKLSSEPKTLIEGDDVTFHCEAVGNPSKVEFRWFVSDILLKDKTSKSLVLEKISRSLHKNRISCEVTNHVGQSKRSEDILIHYGPTFRKMPGDVLAEVGEEATLKCSVDANPSPSIVWLKKGSTKIIGSGSELHVRVNASSGGTYKCISTVRGKDFDFPELIGNLNLLLKGPPTIVSEAEQQGRLGDTVSIVCSSVSVPSPIKVTWTYNGREIDLNDPRYEIMEDEGKERVRNILVIHDSHSSDFGSYNCSVVNEYGVARKLITLQKEKRIPILLVVGCGVAVVIVAVVVSSLVFCNKKHLVKDNPATLPPEKDFADSNEHSKSNSNMYSMVSETKLNDQTVPLHSKEPDVQVSAGAVPNSSYSGDRRKSYQNNDTKFTTPAVVTSSIHQSLSGEINQKIMQQSYDQPKNYDDDFRYKSQSQHNISYPMEDLNRRTMTNTSLITNPPSQKFGSSANPEYCTIRRGSTPYTSSRGHRHVSPQLSGDHLLGSGISKTPLLSNGSLNYSSPKRSPYGSMSSTSWTPSPQPPPYQRNNFLNNRIGSLPDASGSHSSRNYNPLSDDAALLPRGTNNRDYAQNAEDSNQPRGRSYNGISDDLISQRGVNGRGYNPVSDDSMPLRTSNRGTMNPLSDDLRSANGRSYNSINDETAQARSNNGRNYNGGSEDLLPSRGNNGRSYNNGSDDLLLSSRGNNDRSYNPSSEDLLGSRSNNSRSYNSSADDLISSRGNNGRAYNTITDDLLSSRGNNGRNFNSITDDPSLPRSSNTRPYNSGPPEDSVQIRTAKNRTYNPNSDDPIPPRTTTNRPYNPITTRTPETKVKFTTGSKTVSGATYI